MLAGADAGEQRVARAPHRLHGAALPVLQHLVVDAVGGAAQRKFAQRDQVALAKEVAYRALGLLLLGIKKSSRARAVRNLHAVNDVRRASVSEPLGDNRSAMRSLYRTMAPALMMAALAGPASAGPTPERAASCVAALKVRADALAKRLQAGDDNVQPELMTVLEHGYAFIGDAYLNGLRDKKAAEDRLKAAQEAQVGLSEAQMAHRQAGCHAEATKMLAEAGAINRMFVSTAARARIAKLKKAAAAPG
jgi:hypothetical protein